MSEPAQSEVKPAAMWKRVVAAILDFFTVFFVGGYIIGNLTGGATDGGFDLSGGPAIALFALIIAYFYIGRRRMGGTFWDRVFRISRPQPY